MPSGEHEGCLDGQEAQAHARGNPTAHSCGQGSPSPHFRSGSETDQRIPQDSTASPLSEAAKPKIRAARARQVCSPESIAKQSASCKRAWQKRKTCEAPLSLFDQRSAESAAVEAWPVTNRPSPTGGAEAFSAPSDPCRCPNVSRVK